MSDRTFRDFFYIYIHLPLFFKFLCNFVFPSKFSQLFCLYIYIYISCFWNIYQLLSMLCTKLSMLVLVKVPCFVHLRKKVCCCYGYSTRTDEDEIHYLYCKIKMELSPIVLPF